MLNIVCVELKKLHLLPHGVTLCLTYADDDDDFQTVDYIYLYVYDIYIYVIDIWCLYIYICHKYYLFL